MFIILQLKKLKEWFLGAIPKNGKPERVQGLLFTPFQCVSKIPRLSYVGSF